MNFIRPDGLHTTQRIQAMLYAFSNEGYECVQIRLHIATAREFAKQMSESSLGYGKKFDARSIQQLYGIPAIVDDDLTTPFVICVAPPGSRT